MRINILSPRSNLSGGLRVIATYARLLQDRGHQVTLITPGEKALSLRGTVRALLRGESPRSDDEGHLDDLGVPIRTAARPDYQITNADVPDGDVLIATWWETAFAAAALSPSKGRKYYLIQGHEVFDHLPWQVVRATYHLPLRPLVISDWLARILAEEYGRTDTVLVPNGVDPGQFHAPVRSRQNRPTVGLLYNTNPIKGLGFLLEVIERLKAQRPDLQVVAFGAEPQSAEHSLPADAQYVHRPAQQDIRTIYARCDVFMNGSSGEGFCLPLLEAMACRCPVVSTPVGAAPSLIRDGVNGYLAPVGDVDLFTSRVAQILDLDPPGWADMSAASAEIAAQNDWTTACTRLERAISE